MSFEVISNECVVTSGCVDGGRFMGWSSDDRDCPTRGGRPGDGALLMASNDPRCTNNMTNWERTLKVNGRLTEVESEKVFFIQCMSF